MVVVLNILYLFIILEANPMFFGMLLSLPNSLLFFTVVGRFLDKLLNFFTNRDDEVLPHVLSTVKDNIRRVQISHLR